MAEQRANMSDEVQDNEQDAGRVSQQQHPNAIPGRELVPIKNWNTNYAAQAAVLECYNSHEVHIAPHGKQGERVKKALDYLAKFYGYTMNERMMINKVNAMIAGHEPDENRLDNETGTEHDLSKDQVSTLRVNFPAKKRCSHHLCGRSPFVIIWIKWLSKGVTS